MTAGEHERGWNAGYSAAIHDARVEGSRAHAELSASVPGPSESDHATRALEHIDKADAWANRDGVWALEQRDRMIDRELRLAQIHATLAVAQQVSRIQEPA